LGEMTYLDGRAGFVEPRVADPGGTFPTRVCDPGAKQE
jgi:hypothetical protein